MYKFEVNMSEKDYLDYNMFWLTKSHYGKGQIFALRVAFLVVFVVNIIAVLIGEGAMFDKIIRLIPFAIVVLLFEIFMVKLFALFFKSHIKMMKKRGKPGFSPNSVLEFFEDSFCETTDINKTEQKYSAVERISVVDNKMMYIHINNLSAYVLPIACFESKEQYESFMEFIKTKCSVIDVY